MKTKNLMLSIMLFMAASGVHGQTPDNPAISGDCEWYVSHEKLTIKPRYSGYLAGELELWTGDAPWKDYAESIREVEIKSVYTIFAKTVRGMFAGMKNLRSLDISGLRVTELADKESITLKPTDEGYMFYDTPCPSVITLPEPENLRIEDTGIPLPDFKGVADYIQKVNGNDLSNPTGAKYYNYEEMQQAWAVDKSEKRWAGTYVLMKSASSMPKTYTLNATTGLGTLCYPVAINLISQNKWKAMAYRVTGYRMENGSPTLELTQWNEGTLPANTPVMLFKDGGATITLPTSTSDFSLAPRTVSDEGNLLVGCYGSPTIFGDPDGYVAADSRQYVYQMNKEGKIAFYRVNPDKPMHATSYRCYLELPASSVAEQHNVARYDFTIPSGEETSVLDGLTADVDGNALQGVYDLQGKRVKQMVPGNVYIVNGVKVVVK